MSVAVDVVRDIADLDALRPAWTALAATMQSPLLDHEWFTAAAHAFHRDGELRVVTVCEDGVLTAAAPLVRHRDGRRLTVIGSAALFEPAGWLFASPGALSTLVDAVVRLGSAVVVERVPAASAICERLPELTRGRALAIVRDAGPSYAVATDRPLAALEASLSARTRKALDPRTVAGLRTRTWRPSAAEVDGVLGAFAALEGGGWKGASGSALSRRTDLAAFFARYASACADRQQLRVTTVHVGDDLAAMELAVAAYDRVWGLKIAYDERLSPIGPALRLVHASITAAVADGARSYEFLGSAESWQERWRPDVRQHRLIVVYPWRVAGVVTAARDVAERITQRWRRALRHGAAGA